jgi:hypothetical protein
MGIEVVVGGVFSNKKGQTCAVINTDFRGDILVRFQTSGFERLVRKDHLLEGSFSDPSDYTLIGKVFESNNYGKFEIIEDITPRMKKILFLATGYTSTALVPNIRSGEVKDNLRPSVCGVGYLGEGKYSASDHSNKVWHSMLKRCYKVAKDGANKRYLEKGVTVSNQWLCFQNFADWFNLYLNRWGINYSSDNWQIDKDILGSGLVYSKDDCAIVPNEVNKFHRDISNAKGWKTNKSKSKPFSCTIGGKFVSDFSRKEDCINRYGELNLEKLNTLTLSYPTVAPDVWIELENIIRGRFINGS